MTTQTPSATDAVTLPSDDFTIINGIGPAATSRLHDAGIVTFDQLGETTPDEIFAIVKGTIPGLTLERLTEQDWSGQAREQGRQAEETEDQAEAMAVGNHQHYERFSLVLLLEQDNTVRYTQVKHLPDQASESWAGWDGDKVVNFVTERTQLRLAEAEPASEPAPPVPKSQALPVLRITEVTIRESGGATQGNIMPVTQGWEMHVEWSLISAEEKDLKGNWVVQAHLESIGPGPELSLPVDGPAKHPLSDYVHKDEAAGAFDYALDLVVAPNDVAVGTYEVVVTITWEKADGQPGKLADFYQGDILYIYG
jgi:hypothetical protein